MGGTSSNAESQLQGPGLILNLGYCLSFSSYVYVDVLCVL